jgi:hypothetical protein
LKYQALAERKIRKIDEQSDLLAYDRVGFKIKIESFGPRGPDGLVMRN